MDNKNLISLDIKNSTLNNLVLYEDIDIKLMNLLINSKLIQLKNDEKNDGKNDRKYDEKNKLNKYKMLMDDTVDKIKVVYHKPKNHKFGRVYAKHGVSAVNLRKDIRHTLFRDKYYDIDIVNSHYTIINNILINNNYTFEKLNDYIGNRDKWINMVSNTYNIDTGKSKSLFIKLLYSGSYLKWLNENKIDENNMIDEIIELTKELKQIYKIIKNNNKLIYDDLKLKDAKVCDTTIISYFCSEIENRILENIYIFCVDNNIIINNDCSLCYDGIMLKKENINDITELLKNIEINIFEKLNLTIKLKVKDMDEGYNYDEIIKNINFKSILDLNTEINHLENITYELKDNKRILSITNKKLKRENLIVKELDKINNKFEKDKLIYEGKNTINYDEYIDLKEQFEKQFFKLKNGVHYVEEKTMNHYDNKKLKEYVRDTEYNCFYESSFGTLEPFIDKWLDDKNKRYHNNIVFEPELYNSHNENNDYNLFKGFKYDILDEKIDDNFMFIKLLIHICNNNKITYNKIEYFEYEYILSWISHIINNPHIKTKTAIVLFSSEKGVGKNALTDALELLFGIDLIGKLESIDDLTKKFNHNLTNKLLIFGDEICAKANKLNDILKNCITRSKCNLERKGIDPLLISDYANYLLTTNNDNAFKIEQHDRRMFMIRCNTVILDELFFNQYYDELKDHNKLIRLFNFFKQYEDKFNIGGARVPQTLYKAELENETRPAYIQFLYKDVKNICGRDWNSIDLYNQSKLYASKSYLSNSYTITEFGINMAKMKIEKIRKKTGMAYRFPNELLFRKHLYEIDKNYYKSINNIDITDELTFEDDGDDDTEENNLNNAIINDDITYSKRPYSNNQYNKYNK